MNLFQYAWAKVGSTPKGPMATEQAADAISETITDERVARTFKKRAANAVHYAMGAAIGAVYGVTGGVVPFLYSYGGSFTAPSCGLSAMRLLSQR
jgi:hypothetical protein